MIFILIILVLMFIVGVAWYVYDKGDSIVGPVLSTVAGTVLIIVLFAAVKWGISSDSLTGYVYQRNEAFGYASYSLRFSQNAGTDEQPSFCVKAGSEEDNKIRQYVGTDTKVQISTPTSPLRLVNNPFECTAESKLDKVLKESAE